MTMRGLVDINVLLDVLANRQPFVDDAAALWSAAETGRMVGIVSADSMSTVYYLLRRASNHRAALGGLRLIRAVFEIATLDESVIHQAMDSPIADFEDAIQYHTAIRSGADCIVTRDLKHFRKSELPVLTPAQLLHSLPPTV